MGLSPSLAAALATVHRHGPLTPSELADRERVKRPTVTRVVNRLEEAGLVTRTPDPKDRRSCLIALSEEGALLLEEMRTRKNAALATRLRELPPADRATLSRAAELLEQLWDAERKA